MSHAHGGRPGSSTDVELASGPVQRRVFARRIRTGQFLVLAFLGFVLAIGPPSEFLAGHPLAIGLVGAGVAAIFASLCVRVLRLGVVAEHDRALVRNVLRTYRLPRSSIASFDPPPRYGRMMKAGLQVRLTSGRTLSASAFVTTPLDVDDSLQSRATDQLNTWLSHGLSALPPERRLAGWVLWLWRGWLGCLTLLVGYGVVSLAIGLIDPSFGQ